MKQNDIITRLLTVLENNSQRVGKNVYKIDVPDILVGEMFAECVKIIGDLCVVAVPEDANSEELEKLLDDHTVIKISSEDYAE